MVLNERREVRDLLRSKISEWEVLLLLLLIALLLISESPSISFTPFESSKLGTI